MFLLPARLTKEDRFYAWFNERGINLIDRVNGKPVYVYHYSIDRPNANWKAPCKKHHLSDENEDEDDWGLNDDDENEDEDDWGLNDDDENGPGLQRSVRLGEEG